MHAAIAVPGNSRTILTHVFGRGLEDERYVVERYRAMADGDIRQMSGDETPAKSRRKVKRTVASLETVREMRPAPTEIIVCTGLRIKGGSSTGARSRRACSASADRNAERLSPGTPRRPRVGRASFVWISTPAGRTPRWPTRTSKPGARATWSDITGAPPSAAPRACARSAVGGRPRPSAACASRAPRRSVPPTANATAAAPLSVSPRVYAPSAGSGRPHPSAVCARRVPSVHRAVLGYDKFSRRP